MSIDRLERLDSLLRRVIAEGMFRIMQTSPVPPAMLTVTGVKCSKDMRDASVSVSVFGGEREKKAALAALRARARDFQALVNREVRMKFTPRLAFKLDLSIEKGDETLAILDRLAAADAGNAQAAQETPADG